jgi:glycine cleavage system aminomethyltransferase T
MELATMTDDEKIIALSGRLKVKVKVEGESKLFENATIVDTGTTDTGQKVYLVRYTDESGVLSDPIMVSAEAIKRRNLVSDDEE